MSAPKSDKDSTDWQHYWDNWFQTQRGFLDQQMKDLPSTQNQWSNFFDAWKTNLDTSLPGAGNYQQYFQQAGKQYLDMLQHFQVSTGQEKSVAETTGDWLKNLQQHFLGMLQFNTNGLSTADSARSMYETMMKAGSAWATALQPGHNPFAPPQGLGAFNNFSPAFGNGFGQNIGNNIGPGMGFNIGAMTGFNNFNPFAQPQMPQWGAGFAPQNAGFNPQQWAQAFNPQAFQHFDPFGFYASIPGIGYTREKQDELNQLYKFWTEFEAQVKKYNAAMAQVGLEAIYKFQEYINNPPSGDAGLNSLKEVYAKWVDICEEVYAKYAMSEEYTKLYGEVVNALMAFKGQLNLLTDKTMDQLNLPTRKEVDSLHERMHEMRRENRELRKIVDEIRGVKSARPAAQAKPAKKGGRK